MTPSSHFSSITNGAPIVSCAGVSWWKQKRIRNFLKGTEGIRFFPSPGTALSYAAKKKAAVAVWANKVTPSLQKKAASTNTPLFIIEDGFIRSIGLGSGFLPPCSIIMDRQAPYVDPSLPSDLEDMLANATISSALKGRAATLINVVRKLHISKYGTGESSTTKEKFPQNHRKILVPGQVAGDISVIRGGGNITDNLTLLQEVRRLNPDAWIVYRPHPDVKAGHRSGRLEDKLVHRYANMIHCNGNMSNLLDEIDEVHTLTSLTGFEALLRDKKVTTYGAPFYAGWGLTNHLGPALIRRKRRLDLLELAAISLILYPLYLNPETEKLCEVEDLIACFDKPELWQPTFTMRLRKKQGQLRNIIVRFISLIIRPNG